MEGVTMSFGKMNGFADIVKARQVKDSEGFTSTNIVFYFGVASFVLPERSDQLCIILTSPRVVAQCANKCLYISHGAIVSLTEAGKTRPLHIPYHHATLFRGR